jgi:hypothetical protein
MTNELAVLDLCYSLQEDLKVARPQQGSKSLVRFLEKPRPAPPALSRLNNHR